MEAPYNIDENCGIKGRGLEKSARVLVGFAKTDVIGSGESETVTVTFETDDLASYDYCGYGCYVLEKGEYQFHVSENAHDVIETADASLDESYVYDDDHDGKRDSDQTAAVNQLDDVSAGDGNRIGMSWGHYGLFNNILRDEWGFIGYLITDGVGPGFTDLYNPPSLCLASKVAMLTRDDRVDEETYTVVEGTGAVDTLYGQYMLRENMHRLFYQMVATGNDAGTKSAAANAVSSDNNTWKIGWALIDVILALGIILIYVFGVHKQFTKPMLEKRNRKE